MTKREWKRRYMHERKLRKQLKWLSHKLKRNIEASLLSEPRYNCFGDRLELAMAIDYFTKPTTVPINIVWHHSNDATPLPSHYVSAKALITKA